MNLLQLWWNGVVDPSRAFRELGRKPAPHWGFWMVVFFNVMISLCTLLPLHLLGRGPQMESGLTFVSTENYLAAEIFFLPVVRVGVWLMEGAIIHLGIRLGGEESNIDQILNIGGLAYLVVMPPLLVSDWILIAMDLYRMEITGCTHGLAALWGLFLSVVGLKEVVGVRSGLAVGLSLLGMIASISILAVFAR